MLEFIIPYVLGFATLIAVKSLAEPVATRIGQLILAKSHAQVKKILPQVWDSLDLEWIPQGHIDRGISTYEWLVNTAIPEKAKENQVELDEGVVTAIANHVLNNFDLDKHLSKLGQRIN